MIIFQKKNLKEKYWIQLDKKLKIAIIGTRGYPYVYSGYETLVKELSERLVKSGYHVRVYCHSSLFNKKRSCWGVCSKDFIIFGQQRTTEQKCWKSF